MKVSAVLLGHVVLLLVAARPIVAGEIDPGLRDVLDATPADQTVSTLVYLKEQVDLKALSARLDRIQADRRLRHKLVVEALQATAAGTQADLLMHLATLQADDASLSFESCWIANVVRVDAPPAQIIELARRDDVGVMYLNFEIELIEPVREGGPQEALQEALPDGRGSAQESRRGAANYPEGSASPDAAAEGEHNIRHIQADRVWNELGITGEGMLVATIDTGVDGNHPALASRWRGVADPRYEGHPEWAWFDPVNESRFPQDFDQGMGHGTHTMGTVTGDGGPLDKIGVAPGAQWIAAAPVGRRDPVHTIVLIIRAFQWMADPDGDPNTSFDVPHVCSNSWGLLTGQGFPPCDEIFWQYIDASEAAGTVQLFAAGNEGNGPGGVRRPADRATTPYDSLAVGACAVNEPDCVIASFSSRGPSRCTPNGDPAVKPELTAPGVNIRSSVPDNQYAVATGTSMSTPHINGTVALMRQANPDAGNEEIKQVLYDTATDRGAPGEDNDYGHGVVNAYEAVLEVMGDPVPYACCFADGACEDLLRSDCIDRGGKSSFAQSCDTFHCPQPGACCLSDAECEVMLEAECLLRGGDFVGEDVGCERACPCDLVKKLKVACKRGTIKALVKFVDDRRDGEFVKIGVGDRDRFNVEIHGRKATLYTCCYDEPQGITLLDPQGCVDPKVADCG